MSKEVIDLTESDDERSLPEEETPSAGPLRDAYVEELEDVLRLGTGEVMWTGSRLGRSGDELLLGAADGALLRGVAERSRDEKAVLARMIAKGLDERGCEPWCRGRCGSLKAESTKRSCCLEHMRGGRALEDVPLSSICLRDDDEGRLLLEKAPTSDVAFGDDAAFYKRRVVLAESVASSACVKNEDRRKWLAGALGAKLAAKAKTKGDMVCELKKCAGRKGIFGSVAPLWAPLKRAIALVDDDDPGVFRLHADVGRALRRAKRLYSAICDGPKHAASLAAGNGFFRPSLEARFTSSKDTRTSCIAPCEATPFPSKGAFERWEAAVELRATQDLAVRRRAEENAAKHHERRRRDKLDRLHDGQDVRERRKDPKDIAKDRARYLQFARDRASSSCDHRPPKAQTKKKNILAGETDDDDDDDDDVLADLAAAFLPVLPLHDARQEEEEEEEGPSSLSRFLEGKGNLVSTGENNDEDSSMRGVLEKLVGCLGDLPAVAVYGVWACAVLYGGHHGCPSRRGGVDLDPFVGVNATSVLAEVAFRGAAGDALANGSTLEATCDAEDVAVLLRWLAGLEEVPPRLRADVVGRASILLGSRHANDPAGRFSLLVDALKRDDAAKVSKFPLDARLSLEHDVAHLYRTRKAAKLAFDDDDSVDDDDDDDEKGKNHDDALSSSSYALRIVEVVAKRKATIPVEVLEGGNPLGRRVGEHSALVAADRDDDDVRGFGVGVEEFALDFYEKQRGYWGSHSEGALLLPLGRLLLKKAILAQVPGAFVHPRDLAPRDYGSSQFATRREAVVDDVLERVSSLQQQADIAGLVEEAYADADVEDRLFFPSQGKADVPLSLLQAIALGLSRRGLEGFLRAFADLGCRRGGLPDLLLLRVTVGGKEDDDDTGTTVPPKALLEWLLDRDVDVEGLVAEKAKPKLNLGALRTILAAEDDDALPLALNNNGDVSSGGGGLAAAASASGTKRDQAAAVEATRARLRRPIDPRILADPSVAFECRLVEVKSYNDTLMDVQRLWIDKLLGSVDVKVAALPLSDSAKAKDRTLARAKRSASKNKRKRSDDSPNNDDADLVLPDSPPPSASARRRPSSPSQELHSDMP